ncbi:MAG TPA: hypothetical protein VII67_07185 [Acidimicrobiales bacterium]
MVVDLLGVVIYLKGMALGAVVMIVGLVVDLLGVVIYLKGMALGAVVMIVGQSGVAIFVLYGALGFRLHGNCATLPLA